MGDYLIDLDQAQRRLEDATDRLATHLLGLDESRQTCRSVAEHYQDFALRIAGSYPSLAGPAVRLADLHRELSDVLGRFSAETETLVASSGHLADVVGAHVAKQK